ncbi:hypothetical protein [Niallia sp. NCCP-28]|nr:hypothetical protein [Niallia sp. NCCP-28]
MTDEIINQQYIQKLIREKQQFFYTKAMRPFDFCLQQFLKN